MIKFNEIASEVIEQEKYYYLAELELGDLFSYNAPSIIESIAEHAYFERDLSDSEQREYSKYIRENWDAVAEYLYANSADLLSIGYGYHITRGYFALASCEEIETELDFFIPNSRLTTKRIETINRYSDIYISSDRRAYVSCQFHLDIELKLDEIDAAILAQIEAIA